MTTTGEGFGLQPLFIGLLQVSAIDDLLGLLLCSFLLRGITKFISFLSQLFWLSLATCIAVVKQACMHLCAMSGSSGRQPSIYF